MNKNNPCQCQSECKTKRCPCLKEWRACSPKCQCHNCQNPFNQIDASVRLSDCARHNIKKVVTLSDVTLEKKYQLPCGHASISLKELLKNHTCQSCDEPYYYSFCFDDVMDTNSMWHCGACGTCCDDGVWHCKYCNRCTYGLTLRCDNCGKKSPYAPRRL
jgi:hypothetical protein